MKNKSIIVLIITIVIALLILGIIYFKKQENLTVTLYYTGNSLEYDIETHSYKKNKIALTPEEQKEIIKLYRKTNTKIKKRVQLAIIGTIELKFSDGNVISMDKNNDPFGYINHEYCISLSKGFKEYILNIID